MFQNISISYSNPLWKTQSASKIISYYSGYSHIINALGGYWSNSIKFFSERSNAEDWYDIGIGRDITCYNPSGNIIWNGFVNEIEVQLGTLTATRGPLINIANRVDLVYSTIDTST